MEIFSVKIGDLTPADYNPRQMTEKQAEDLKESIKRFGIVDPLVVNSYPGRENIIIGGTQRWKIARELGHKKIDVVYVSLDEEKERELNLRLNRNLGEWDWTLLTEFDSDLLLDVGFLSRELESMFHLDFDPEKEWEGMPEFMQDDLKPFRTIHVHFEDQKAVGEFAKLVGQKITEKTRFIWFPELKRRKLIDKRYVEEP